MSKNGHQPIDKAGFLKPIFQTRDVAVPELGTVRLREMSAAARAEYRADVLALADAPAASTEQSTWALKVLARHVIDADGEPVFTLDPADLAILGGLPDRTVEYLVGEALELSGLKVTRGDDSGNSVPSVDSTTS